MTLDEAIVHAREVAKNKYKEDKIVDYVVDTAKKIAEEIKGGAE